MRRLFLLLLPVLVAMPLLAQKDADSRLKAAAEDLHEIMQAQDKGIPQDLLQKAECVIVIPNLKKGGFIIGGKYGRGFFSCRKRSGVGLVGPRWRKSGRRKFRSVDRRGGDRRRDVGDEPPWL